MTLSFKALSAMSENGGHWKWKWRSVTMFLSLFLLHGFAILLFTRGFLLTRSELSEYSQCGDVYQSPCFTPPKNDNQTKAGSCWTKPAVERLVIIVLDALRFDFAAPSTFFPEKKPWMDKLQILHKVASQNQSSSRIFKAIADPPTTSLQRLKGLTTGGLPTFIDVGNSFGAPAIVEDNLIHQLVQNGKRVVMMGDDTWTQLFPHHFIKSYPFPSFNVKDLDTVDNGCIENLFPALHEEDWDVLIAHFLGVDHAGHIFGVESTKMTDKLEQYNDIIEKVIGVLESQSGPGGVHENTMLLVMGDHGQTLNGDHGGGTAEEVETAIFALSLNKPPPTTHAEIDSLSCKYDTRGRNICVSSIQQLDFAVTVSALLGLPFPFGSIGRVNVDLFSLAGGTWNMIGSAEDEGHVSSKFKSWMQNYANVLCINSWQVKKYIDVYSSLSLIGFSEKDLLHVRELYSKAQELWSITSKNFFLVENENASASLTSFRRQLDAYSMFLQRVASLARSSWTEFNLKLMGMGLCILLGSLFLHAFFILKLEKLSGCHSSTSGWKSIWVIFAILVVLIRAFSFLSNSYILEEGRVASFLLATTGMLQLRHAIIKRTRLLEALVLCLLVLLLRISIEFGQLKQAVNSLFLKVDPTQVLGIGSDSQYLAYTAEALPILAIIIEACFLYKIVYSRSSWGIAKCVITGAFFTYLLIPLYWASHSGLLSPHLLLGGENGNIIPRAIYATGLVQLSLLALDWLIARRDGFNMEEITVTKALALLSAWSSPIMILSGKHGPLFVLGFVIGGFCLIRLMALEGDPKSDGFGSSFCYAIPVIQWSLLAVCFFFGTGHWCTFDGLRYASAFVGFDEFNIVRQAILLTIETFGFSHIIPIFGLPLLIACSRYPLMQNKQIFSLRLSQAYLIYGLVASVTTTFTMLCVTIQRRHLMVWGLFAPKFVFDVAGLLLGDLLILLSSLYFIV